MLTTFLSGSQSMIFCDAGGFSEQSKPKLHFQRSVIRLSKKWALGLPVFVNHASAVRQAKASGIAVAILKTSVFNGWALTCATLLVAAKAQHVQCVLNETSVLVQNSSSITCKSFRRCHKPINLQAFLCNIVLIALQRRTRSAASLKGR
jgi:hypothetical protein